MVARTPLPGLAATARGRLCALGSAAAFGAIPPLGRLAYDAGASPGSVVLARLLFGLLITGVMVAVMRRPWVIPRREWPGTGVVCIAWILVTVGYMASFFYIPVSLAVLIFFTFPVLIAVIGPAVARRPPEAAILAAAIVAFCGLALALGPDIQGLDWRGCLLAAAASIGATTTFLVSQYLIVERDLFTFSFYLHVVCSALVMAGFALIGMPDPPVGGLGWSVLAGVGVFYITAVLLQFGAIRLAGPARASVVFNAEPVLTMVAAAVVLGEILGTWQLAGAALIVFAVLLSSRTTVPH